MSLCKSHVAENYFINDKTGFFGAITLLLSKSWIDDRSVLIFGIDAADFHLNLQWAFVQLQSERLICCSMRSCAMCIYVRFICMCTQICSFIFLFLSRRFHKCICLFVYFALLNLFYCTYSTCSVAIDTYARAHSLMISEKLFKKLQREREKKVNRTKNVLAEYRENYLFPSSMAHWVFFYSHTYTHKNEYAASVHTCFGQKPTEIEW